MKLPTLLKALDPEEFKAFEKFLQSPYFKASDQYLKFFKDLCKHHPAFDLEKEDLQKAYVRCFGLKSLNETKLYNLMSGLSKQLEQFFVVEMVQAPDDPYQPSYHDILLVKSLGKRNMGVYFRTKTQQLIEKTAGREKGELGDYLIQYDLYQEIYYNPDTPKDSEHPPYLPLAVENLDIYYCLAKLRHIAEMKTRERVYRVQYQLPYLELVLAHSASPELQKKHPLLAIYYQLVNLYLKGIDESGFRNLKSIFEYEFKNLAKADQLGLLRHLINCGISLLNKDFLVEAELLSIYKLAISANMLLDGDRITHSSFINIINLAGLCHEFDWAATFLEQFSPYLEESKRRPTVAVANAGLHYKKGHLDEAQRWLIPEISQVPGIDILGRAMLIKIVFDRYILLGKDYEFLIAQINAYEKYIPGQVISEPKKEAELNWLKFVRKMTTTKFENVTVLEAKKEKLRKSLEGITPVVYKGWLREKIEVL